MDGRILIFSAGACYSRADIRKADRSSRNVAQNHYGIDTLSAFPDFIGEDDRIGNVWVVGGTLLLEERSPLCQGERFPHECFLQQPSGRCVRPLVLQGTTDPLAQVQVPLGCKERPSRPS